MQHQPPHHRAILDARCGIEQRASVLECGTPVPLSIRIENKPPISPNTRANPPHPPTPAPNAGLKHLKAIPERGAAP